MHCIGAVSPQSEFWFERSPDPLSKLTPILFPPVFPIPSCVEFGDDGSMEEEHSGLRATKVNLIENIYMLAYIIYIF